MPDDYERALARLNEILFDPVMKYVGDALFARRFEARAGAMEKLLRSQLLLLRDFGKYLPEQSTLKQAADKALKEFADGR